MKRLHRPRRKVHRDKGPSSDLASKTAGQHSVVLRAIASGTVILESAEKQKSMIISSQAMASEIQQTSTAIDEMRSKFKQSIIQIYLYWAELNYLSLFILDISCKLLFLEVQ